MTDGIVDVEPTEVICRQRLVPSNGIADRLNKLAVHLESFGGSHAASVQASGPMPDHGRHDVHFEKGEPHLFARGHSGGKDFGLAALIGVAIPANAVAIL